MRDIFGYQEGTHHFSGLVDSDLPSDFDDQLDTLKDQWNERECMLRSSTSPVFHEWFVKYQIDVFKSNMLKALRQRAGLGNPPSEYTNKANESANARIKEKVNYKKSELDIFCQKIG